MKMVSGDQKERLQRARAVLVAAEGQQQVRSVAQSATVQRWEQKGVHHLDGHIETLIRVLVEQEQGTFTALVGVKDVGWDRAMRAGVDVDRVVVIEDVANQVGKVVGTLLEGFSVVVVGEVDISPRHQRALAGRARKLRSSLITMSPWTGVTLPHPQLETQNSLIKGVVG